ncbi:restin homolog [Lytechinus variegatus]|uniref:restin homolog n=1 Tax=Lytechinus variegatus TaxID=7654 RepID=UPI001BB29AC6|nr:restin homolog [Lytechinus variegatus]XP_041470539.1 restin homolog [Lytechinus variegatus]
MVGVAMDLSGSDNSSDSIGSPSGSFEKLWGTESALMRGLKDGSLAGLTDLVHDKDVAAKAVAFVVNSSRRGIVPLCADVAAILRNKLKLERTIEKQRAEIQRLKKSGASLSGRTSRSTSPTHPHIDMQMLSRQSSARLKKPAESPLLSSPCSPCSSPRSPSPPLPNSLELSSASCGSLADVPSMPHPQESPVEDGEPHPISSSSSTLLPNQRLVLAEVHRVPSVTSIQSDVHSHASTLERRSIETRSLPSEVPEGDMCLQQQYQEACQAREALENELLRVRAELEEVRLGSKVKEWSPGDKETGGVCGFQIENEMSPTPLLKRSRSHSIQGISEVPHPPLSPTHDKQNDGLPPIASPRQVSPRNPDPTSPINRGDGISSTRTNKTENNQNNLTVRLEDHVLIKGERTGFVRFIGHLEKSSVPNTVFVGLHLDAPVGKHDGMVHGVRYFWCPRNHGIFVPVNDILAVINRKPLKRTKTADTKRKGSSRGGVGAGVFPTSGYDRGEMKKTRPGHARRLISADSSMLPSTHKNRDHTLSTS